MGDFAIQINGTTDEPALVINTIDVFLKNLRAYGTNITRADFSDTTTGSVSLMGEELVPSGEVDDEGNPVVSPEPEETPSNEPEENGEEATQEDGA